MCESVKNKTRWKKETCKDYIKNGRTETSYFKVQSAINTISEKNDYNCHLALTLSNPETSLKVIGQFLSFTVEKKPLLIYPLLHNYKLISDFREKAHLFNNLFALNCLYFPKHLEEIKYLPCS